MHPLQQRAFALDQFSARPSLTSSIDSGIASLPEDADRGARPRATYRRRCSSNATNRPDLIRPGLDHHARTPHASFSAKFWAATLHPSQRVLKHLMTDIDARDVELGSDCHPQDTASALKAMVISAEATLRALGKARAVKDRHCAFIASVRRCETVLTAIDDRHGYSARSKHSSRRLLWERTSTALNSIRERYDASRQILVDAHGRLPDLLVHPGNQDILLQPDNVIHLMRHGAGKSVAGHEQIADEQVRRHAPRRTLLADPLSVDDDTTCA